MANHEHISKKEFNPARELERHLAGLGETQRDIKDFRMRTHLGRAGMPLTMHDKRGRHQFADVAAQYADTLDSRRDPEAKMYAGILAVIPNTVGAMHALQRRDEFETKDYHAAIHMIEFNHVLREIVETNPTIQPKVVTNLIRSTTLRYGYGADIANETVEETQKALYGIKHELAFEAALYYLPDGYEIYEASNEEDKHGADFKVRCPNGVVISIDVKSSPESVEWARRHEDAYLRRGGRVKPHHVTLYSGFTSEDFDSSNPWQPRPEAVERVLPAIETALQEASGYSGTPALEAVR